MVFLAAAEPVHQPSAEAKVDTPPIVMDVTSTGDEVPREQEMPKAEEPTAGAAMGIAVSAKAPASQLEGGEVAAEVAGGADEGKPPSYAEVIGKARESAPDANAVRPMTMDRVLSHVTEKGVSEEQGESLAVAASTSGLVGSPTPSAEAGGGGDVEVGSFFPRRIHFVWIVEVLVAVLDRALPGVVSRHFIIVV